MTKLVQVWSGDPTYGSPKEGVFYMERPYTPEQWDEHVWNRAKRWNTALRAKGMIQTTGFDIKGPFAFLDVGRRDMSHEHEGDDEWVLIGWFKRADGKPGIVSMSEIEDRREMAKRYGLVPAEPIRGEVAPKPVLLVADEMGEYNDPNHLNEAGIAEESMS